MTTTNWKKTSLALALTLSSFAFAGDRGGNGGSGTETQIAAEQAQLESVALKLKKFFIQNEQAMAQEFPEFAPQALVRSISGAELSVSNENLVDRYGVNRTCLNFPAEQKIECNYSEVKSLQDDPKALFVLVMHEYLGLMGVEETSPENPRMIDGYSISKRIAPYVTRVSEYDLFLNQSVNQKLVEHLEKFRSQLSDKEFIKVKKAQQSNARLFSGEQYYKDFGWFGAQKNAKQKCIAAAINMGLLKYECIKLVTFKESRYSFHPAYHSYYILK